MSLEEKYKDVIINFNYILYGVEGLLMDEETLAEDYLTIQPYENEIRNDYEANREKIEAVISNRHFSHEELDDSYWFIAGAYKLCEKFRVIRRKKQLEANIMNGGAVSLHPKTFEENEWSDWMIEVFKGNRKRLSFFFERCDGKKCPDIVREIRGAMMANFIAIKEDDYDKRRYGEMRQAMSEYGYKTGDEKGSQWNQCMNEDKEKNGKVNKIPSIKAKYEEFMKSEAF